MILARLWMRLKVRFPVLLEAYLFGCLLKKTRSGQTLAQLSRIYRLFSRVGNPSNMAGLT